MTSRLPGWQDDEGSLETTQASAVGRLEAEAGYKRGTTRVPGSMVDEAVQNVVREQGIDPGVAAAFKAQMGRDFGGPVASNFYTSKAAAARSRASGVTRKDLTIRYDLDDDSIRALTEYAPEFRLRFEKRDGHDHPMAAATRMIDHQLIAAKIPAGVRVSDVGGDPLTHIRSEHTHVHVCGPLVDTKDLMRHKLRGMEAKKIAQDQSRGDVTRALAGSYLKKDGVFCCNSVAQECYEPTPVITSVHVYDIPMQDWPVIMENKGASVVEGCMLFSPKFFKDTSGVLGVSQSRYEIDVKANKFRMGFVNSPSWWYEHDFDEFVRYGCDQLMFQGKHTYSYKIVERRGDTIFFRVLRMLAEPSEQTRFNAYNTPGVPVVRVRGFELQTGSYVAANAMRRRDWVFPRSLWTEMVSQASEDFERGVLDVNKMYAHYRTMSVRNTVNAVLVMGGDPVSDGELVPLVVHSCLAAAASCLLGQRETRAITEAEMMKRRKRDENTFVKIFKCLGHFTVAVLTAPLLPFKVLAKLLKFAHSLTLERWILDWEPVCTYEVASIKPMLLHTRGLMRAPVAVDMARKAAAKAAVFDHYAAMLADPRLGAVIGKICPVKAAADANPVGGFAAGGAANSGGAGSEAASTAPPTYATDEVVDATYLSDMRKAAIREHIAESELQENTLRYDCEMAYKELVVRGNPMVDRVRYCADKYKNPNFWKIVNGVIVESALGLSVENFVHSAVYFPETDAVSKSPFRNVYRRRWAPGDRYDEDRPMADNFVVDDSRFCGWVYTSDVLLVYNGPQIMQMLHRSLLMDHRYNVVMMQGPPGCGKTRAIVNRVAPDGGDLVMCPVRESIVDTRGQIAALHPGFVDLKLHVRTVDSYLVNYESDPATGAMRVRRLLADECFMAHAAKWYAAAALSGAGTVLAYGDEFQIPHVPRVQATNLHTKIVGSSSENTWLTYRCPPTSVAAWGHVYGHKVRSASGVHSVMQEVSDTRGLEVPDGCVMMCMFQADKKTLSTMYSYARKRIKIMTAHESEGKTFEHVWLHRFDSRARTDKFSFFDRQPYVLVALSRHTRGFVYCRPPGLNDLVSEWILKSRDPRRVAAAADVETAGQPVEFI